MLEHGFNKEDKSDYLYQLSNTLYFRPKVANKDNRVGFSTFYINKISE